MSLAPASGVRELADYTEVLTMIYVELCWSRCTRQILHWLLSLSFVLYQPVCPYVPLRCAISGSFAHGSNLFRMA